MKPSFPKGYLPTLDGWRAISILLVLSYHGIDSLQRAYGENIEWLVPYLHSGWVGVSIFFGISGFLITSRLLEEQAARGSINLKQFYLRRALRILPPIVALLIVLSLLALLAQLPVSWTDRIRALCFSINYGPLPGWYVAHAWSLSVEEHFYLIWPFVLVALGCYRAIIFGLAASAVITVWRIVDIHYLIVSAYIGGSAWRTDTNLDYLLLGSVVGCLMSRSDSRASLKKMLTPPVALLLIASQIAALALWSLYPHLEHPARFYLAAVIPLILAGTVLHPRQILGRILEWSWLRWLGRLSYSLYLWQQMFFVPTSQRTASLGWLQDWPFNFLAALTCSIASYHLIERPFIKLGHRLTHPVTEGRSDLVNA